MMGFTFFFSSVFDMMDIVDRYLVARKEKKKKIKFLPTIKKDFFPLQFFQFQS